MHPALQFALALLLALPTGTLVEYTLHRLMHSGRWLLHTPLGRVHANHHKVNEGQGWLWEFFDYSLVSLGCGWPGFLVSWPAGLGWALGAFLYAGLAAYCHQLQHERPELARCHVHRLHHTYVHQNFGITVDWWDHVFRTYRTPTTPPRKGLVHWYDLLAITWW